MSIASEELADRIRALVGHLPSVTEKRMFGGRSFLLHGNMICAATPSGSLLARVGAERQAEMAARSGAQPMQHAGRIMTGFVEVTDGLEDDEALAEWLHILLSHVRTLPPKT